MEARRGETARLARCAARRSGPEGDALFSVRHPFVQTPNRQIQIGGNILNFLTSHLSGRHSLHGFIPERIRNNLHHRRMLPYLMHPRDVRRRHFMQPGAGRTFRSILPAFGHERELVSGANSPRRIRRKTFSRHWRECSALASGVCSGMLQRSRYCLAFIWWALLK